MAVAGTRLWAPLSRKHRQPRHETNVATLSAASCFYSNPPPPPPLPPASQLHKVVHEFHRVPSQHTGFVLCFASLTLPHQLSKVGNVFHLIAFTLLYAALNPTKQTKEKKEKNSYAKFILLRAARCFLLKQLM